MASIPGTDVTFGERFFIALIAKAVAEYLRHKGNIDSKIPPGVVDALAVLVEAIPELLTLNAPGPE